MTIETGRSLCRLTSHTCWPWPPLPTIPFRDVGAYAVSLKGRCMPAEARGCYRFDQFTLDLDRGALLGSKGEELALRPKSFLMLEYFVEHAERLIDRDELMHAV